MFLVDAQRTLFFSHGSLDYDIKLHTEALRTVPRSTLLIVPFAVSSRH